MKSIAQLNLNAIQGSAGLKTPGDVGGIISNILPWGFGLASFLLLIYMVSGGLQIMTSQGEPKAISSGQAKITNALLGFTIILVSAGLVVLIGNLLGINVFKNIF